MNRILSALALSIAAALCSASEPPIRLAENVPDRHIVVPGDTLWGISGKFLKEPWRWPEIWRMNKEQIKNPHRIYPGDVIVLEYDANGNPQLRHLQNVSSSKKLQPRIYSEQNSEAIPPIPPNVIEPFLSEPLIVETENLNSAPRIVATQEGRVFLGNGDKAYVDNADPAQKVWQVYRNGKALYDPDNPKQLLGYEAFYLGTAIQTRPGSPATFEINTVKEEMGRGDRLLPMTRPKLVDYVPHKPDVQINGRVIGMYGGVSAGGRGSIVSISRGKMDGLEIGHVLALERDRNFVQRDENDRKMKVAIPSERIGLIFVFRTFDRVSYALVVQSDGPVEVNDFVSTP
ncbi:LysM peptidoglycan-binding domain-containing protein [Propionivibrio limicola]|uniref:LysM peptidoglycan-binding domain-containing protein n=1 Tax=Propionivibrio limicola TaxID=167645 RepID=UPI0012912408|nr:LysM peptidoglycan-binding domain-containing protein [Propionivibrio limicola]